MPPRTRQTRTQTRTQAGRTATTSQRQSGQSKASTRSSSRDGHDVTVNIPVDRAADVATKAAKAPLETAARVLPAKGGLPIYLGLGALGALGVLDWPIAAGIGIGYAALRRGGPLNPAPR